MAAHNSNKEEYELVLGNKQILAAFFLIVALFGVFFTLGFFWGRDSALKQVAQLEQQATSETAERSQNIQSSPSLAGEPKAPGGESAKPSKPAEPQLPSPELEQSPPARSESSQEQSAATPARDEIIEPKPGEQYLQVAALDMEAAIKLRDTLRNRGFPAAIAPSPRPELFRVLVGPFKSSGELNRTLADLHRAGFRPIRREY